VGLVSAALGKLAKRVSGVLVAGEGTPLLKQTLVAARIDCPVIDLGQAVGEVVASCAPAHAAAVLAGREVTGAR
jgi:hypothetical protein